MTFFSGAARFFTLFLILGTVACSSDKETGLYGYEDEYVPPKPDMIPDSPDDKPGRTVEEMLGLKNRAVIVKKAEYAEQEKTPEKSEYQGRFGSKEKFSLRKGLNVPETGMVYGKGHRKPAEEVRALDVRRPEKNQVQTLSEKEQLAQIISPKTEPVRMIEVVPAKTGELPVSARGDGISPGRLTDMDFIPFDVAENKAGREIVLPKAESVPLPVVKENKEENKIPAEEKKTEENTPLQIVTEKKVPLPGGDAEHPFVPKAVRKLRLPPVEGEEIVLSAPSSVVDQTEEEKIVLIPPPSYSESEQTEEIVLLRPPFAEEKTDVFVLLPSDEERIVLKRPEEKKSLPAIEIFLEE